MSDLQSDLLSLLRKCCVGESESEGKCVGKCPLQRRRPKLTFCSCPDECACRAHAHEEPRSCSVNWVAVCVFQNELDVPFTVKAGQIGEFLLSEQQEGNAVVPEKPVSQTAGSHWASPFTSYTHRSQPSISTFKQPEKSASCCLVQLVKAARQP